MRLVMESKSLLQDLEDQLIATTDVNAVVAIEVTPKEMKQLYRNLEKGSHFHLLLDGNTLTYRGIPVVLDGSL